MDEPKIKEGAKEIRHCPLCQVAYEDAQPTNVKITCPDDGGCGRTWLVKVFDEE